MHGSINRAIEMFVRDSYGSKAWRDVVSRLNLDISSFEAMLDYPDLVTAQLVDELSQTMGKPASDVFEDIGTYLVSHPTAEPIRRLLRFSGADLGEFLDSLDELPARARLVIPSLILPQIELDEEGSDEILVRVQHDPDVPIAFGHVLMGLLRAMADDYGALVLLVHRGIADGHENIEVKLLAASYAQGRAFALGTPA
ncbi:MAG: heme NO-binding domain-containing protein [Pseudomonadota bacterium]